MSNLKNLGAIFCAVAVLAVAAVSPGIAPAGAAGDAAAGKTVYSNKCLICHGADGQGATGYAKAMKLQPAVLSSDAVQKKTDIELKKTIVELADSSHPPKN